MTRAESAESAPAMLDVTMNRIDGSEVNLADEYAGNVLLIVNVASKCGYTPQYAGLQQLHERYAEHGLAILGFPANEFGHQEPGTNSEIAQFCDENFGVTFDMFEKVVVKGGDISPLYQRLTSEQMSAFPGEIKWNFEKFLIDRTGRVVARFPSKVEPLSEEITSAIELALSRG